MLPENLISTNKQYKEDTNTIATWLARSAKLCGYTMGLLHTNATTPHTLNRSQRRQKARTQAKLGSSQGVDELKGPKYLIDVKRFISLAQCITDTLTPVIRVPATLSNALDRAIAGRKELLDYHQERSSSDQGHAYFIEVLEKVRTILKPRMDPSMDHPMPDLARNIASNENRFAALTVEDPADIPETAVQDGESTQKADPVESYGVKVHEEEECFIALIHLFKDLEKFRNVVFDAWSNYRLGNDGLTAASVATNTAIDFARKLGQDFTARFPKYSDPGMLSKMYYIALSGPSGLDSQRPGDYFNFACYDAACRAYLPCYILLLDAACAFSWSSVPVYKTGHFGTIDLASDRAQESAREKFDEDKISFMESLQDFLMVCRSNPGNIRGEDEIIRSFRPYIKTKKITIELVFSLQCWLDIRNILRQQTHGPFNELVATADFVKKSINFSLDYHRELSCSIWPESNNQVLKRIIALIDERVERDPWFEEKQKQNRNAGGRELVAADMFEFYRNHPLLCGLLTFTLKLLFHDAALTFANAWGGTLFSCHLYNAVQYTTDKEVFWPDLEWVLSRHGSDHIFVGNRPKTVEESLKRLVLAMGGSAANFTRNRRKNRSGIKHSVNAPRSLKPITPVSSVFHDRFCNPDGARFDFTPADIQKIMDEVLAKATLVQEILVPPEEAEDGDFDPDASRLAELCRSSKQSPEDLKGWLIRRVKYQKYKKCPPEKLLDQLLDEIDWEDENLLFDYFAVHKLCWNLLRDIQRDVHDKMIRFIGPAYLEDEHQLPFIVGYILALASKTKDTAKALLPSIPSDMITSGALVQASHHLEDVLPQPGIGDRALTGLDRCFGKRVSLQGKEYVPKKT